MQSSSVVISFLAAVALLSACAQGPGPGRPGPEGAAAIQGQADYEILFWQSIMDSKDPKMYEAYLRQYPDGVYADLARLRIEKYSQRAKPERKGFWGRFQAPRSKSGKCPHDYDTLRCVGIGEGS